MSTGMGLQTLMDGTRRLRLTDPTISNEELARKLDLLNSDSDAIGMPFCFFFKHGHVAMVRITSDIVGVFHTYQSVAHLIERDGLGSPSREAVQFA